jgi:hypothetical protein
MKGLGIAFILPIFAQVPISGSDVPILVAIPDNLFIGDKHILYQVRARCEWEFHEYKSASEHLNSESAGQKTEQEIANVKILKVKYASDANAFNKAVASEVMNLKARIEKEVAKPQK